MITIIAGGKRYPLVPTIFPDGTSQVWKLPEDIMECSSVDVDWRFDSEREIIDLMSMSKLLKNKGTLHIPYMPYGRQDKEISNSATFNLEVVADLINLLWFDNVTSVDTHNPMHTSRLLNGFRNITVEKFHEEVAAVANPECLIFPDAGACERYSMSSLAHLGKIVCDKTRNQATGQITGHKIAYNSAKHNADCKRFLIVDDICDGGATFISVAKLIREVNPDAWIGLCVTHGIFSKGKDHLLTNGINEVYTTNSLIKNEEGYKV